jgi:hypothetical protein
VGDATAFQQKYRTQYADETARIEINPHKQMMIDLEYFMEELKADGFEVVVFIDANEPINHIVRAQNHDHKCKSENGLYIDGSINGSLTPYVRNCGLSNILDGRHSKSRAEITNTHLRGLAQIDFVLSTPGIVLYMQSIGLLDFDVIFRTDHRTFFIDIDMEGFFGSTIESLPAQQFRQLQLEDPIVSKELINYSHSRNPPCAPARTRGQIQAPREPPN